MDSKILANLPADLDLTRVPPTFESIKEKHHRPIYLKLLKGYFGNDSTVIGKKGSEIVNHEKEDWECYCGHKVKIDVSKNLSRLDDHMLGRGKKNLHPENEWRIQAALAMQNKPIMRTLPKAREMYGHIHLAILENLSFTRFDSNVHRHYTKATVGSTCRQTVVKYVNLLSLEVCKKVSG